METKDISFQNEGQRISAILTIPVKPTQSIVVLAHGGPGGNKRGPDDIFVYFAEHLAKDDIASLRFDFRGSGDSEGDPTKWTMEQQARDLQAALEFVLAEGYTNVGLVGESLGGTIALLGYDSKYKAVALWWPAIYLMDTSLTCYLTEEMLAELAQKGYILDGDTKVGKSFIDEFQQVDLEPYVRKLQNPVLLVHGDEDQEVPYQQSVKALELINTTRQLLILQGGDHGLRKPQEQAEVIEVSLAWFKKYLL